MTRKSPARHLIALTGSIVLHLTLIAMILYPMAHIRIVHKAVRKTIALNQVTLQKAAPPPKPKPTPPPKTPKPAPPKPQIKPEPIVKKAPKIKPRPKKKRRKKQIKRLRRSAPKPQAKTPVQKPVADTPPTPVRSEKPHPRASAAKTWRHESLPQIVRAIEEAKYYPKMARRLHQEGIVKVSFVLEKDGSVHDIEAKARYALLRKAARETIMRASLHFPRPPETLTIDVPIAYRLK